ncbi:MAG: hypothetical protein ACD_3C00083G0014 [uncultured bacterium (gcode 4)]|uniref:Glycosyl transferase CAP10 domain-containing protein n=1 Tax=uncultured bacterium (gcode 4) TaxID=1234023 RepID=K2GXU8_9BACT|nr:MAG: hypothetical protein ACD_3C00083G0014 [uncultured bacterium (gcode 4)]
MIILHNPYTKTFFWQTLSGFILRNNVTKKSQKYRYVLDYLWRNWIKFWIYTDNIETSLPQSFRNKLIIKLEIYFWLLLKNINPLNVKIIDDMSKIGKEDIFFSFSSNTLDSDYHWVDEIADLDFIKIFHFTHFVQNTSLVAKNFKRLKADFIIAENNLINSKYFQNFFKSYNKNTYTLPFVFWKKYLNNTHFSERQNKCLSSWAVININDYELIFDDCRAFYENDTLQPIRKEILDRWHELKPVIDTISLEFKPKRLKNNFIQKMANLIFWTKLAYFDFDIVKKYNQYKMFICWEEINDMPGIWFVEGMACWCAYIWIIDSMYTDLWMIPWIHYIWHNWTLDDVIEKIKYYQEHPIELEEIANNWYKFVTENLNWNTVAEKFYNDLMKLSRDYKDSNYNKKNLIFNCSFVKWKI